MPIIPQTLPAAPGGMNVAYAAQEIDDTEAAYIQDGLLDLPGILRRRGPVQKAEGISLLPREGSAFVITTNPRGTARFAALTGDSSNGYVSVWNDDRSAVSDLAWPHALPTDPVSDAGTKYRLTDTKPALGGGSWIGTASEYDANGPLHALALWRGGNKSDYSTGTVSVTRGSTDVTGSGTSWLTSAVSGMFLFATTTDPFSNVLIGTVLSVNSNTSITLEKASLFNVSGGAYALKSIRGFIPHVSKGRVTTATDSTTVSGGETKFQSQGLGTGAWFLYRASDRAYIGKVSSVTSEISLTLTANAAIATADEGYIAVRADWSSDDTSIDLTLSTNKVGWLTANYAERQWYANNGAQFDKTYRLWFSDLTDPEAVDLSSDGDWIPITTQTDAPEPIRALMPTYNALLVMKDTETFAVYGSSPDSFSAKKLEDDGAISTMTVQSYGGGAVWAGRNGVYFYNGVTAENLTAEKFGDVWRNTVRSLDQTRYRAWGAISRNHYFLFFESLDPTISVVKGSTVTTPDSWVMVINLNSRSIVLHTNVNLRGSAELPADEGRSVWFLVNNDAGKGVIVDSDKLFDSEGRDEFGADGGTPGPDFFFETKKFNAGDDLRLKRNKQFALHYLAQGDSLRIDTVLGLNNLGRQLTTEFPATVLSWTQLATSVSSWDGVSEQFPTWASLIDSVFERKRARFLKKDTHVSFRIYQNSLNMTRVRIGPFQIGYKLMRPGRV